MKTKTYPEIGFLLLRDVTGDRDNPGITPVSRSSWAEGFAEEEYPGPVKLSARTSAWKIVSKLWEPVSVSFYLFAITKNFPHNSCGKNNNHKGLIIDRSNPTRIENSKTDRPAARVGRLGYKGQESSQPYRAIRCYM